MKLKYIIPLVIILVAILVVNHEKSKPAPVAEVQSTTSVVEEKKSVAINEASETKASSEIAPSSPDQKPKKNAVINHKENARETEREFLAMTIPSSFSNVKEVRYQELYNIFLKSTFYLSDVAADRLETNKENLLKALKGLSTYFEENSMAEQTDSALLIIQQEKPGLFEEAFHDLSKKDQEVIKNILKLQSESQ